MGGVVRSSDRAALSRNSEKGSEKECGTPFDWLPSGVPTVFSQDGFRFFFYSNDHRPIHIHVRYQDGEAVFDVEEGVDLRESYGLKIKALSKAEELVTAHRELIVEKWHEYFG